MGTHSEEVGGNAPPSPQAHGDASLLSLAGSCPLEKPEGRRRTAFESLALKPVLGSNVRSFTSLRGAALPVGT